MRSERMGLRLYGMADEPIWCFSNGSSSSSNDWAMRSSCETDETNSDCIFSARLIFSDISLMVSVSSPISSSDFRGICTP